MGQTSRPDPREKAPKIPESPESVISRISATQLGSIKEFDDKKTLTARGPSGNLARCFAVTKHFLGENMDSASAALMTFGLAGLLVSWVLMLIVSWREDYAWGLCTLLLPPLSYLYALFRLDKAGQAILVSIIAWVLILLA
jgi:hypothetical protein